MTLDPARRAEIKAWAVEWVRHKIDPALMKPDPMALSYDLGWTFYTTSGESDAGAIRAAIAAAASDPVAFDALCWTGAGHLQFPDNNPNMPEELRLFLAGVLSGRLKRPKGKKRTHPARDMWVFCLVDEMTQAFRLFPTKNPEAEHDDSACDIAGEVLQSAGFSPTSYDRIKDIWERHNRALLLAQRGDRNAFPP